MSRRLGRVPPSVHAFASLLFLVAEQRAEGNETVIEGQKKALELALHGAPLHEVLEVHAAPSRRSRRTVCSDRSF